MIDLIGGAVLSVGSFLYVLWEAWRAPTDDEAR